MKDVENRIRNISNLLRSADRNLRKAQGLLDSLYKDSNKALDDAPGVVGVFDGEKMVVADGKAYEVNPNYAAKSMLVAGDDLKMAEKEDGAMRFKQVSKVKRRSLKGLLNKKEGKWCVLTDVGSYRVLDVAVEFRNGKVKDEVSILVPEDNLRSEYAALEDIVSKEGGEEVVGEAVSSEKEKKLKSTVKKETEAPEIKPKKKVPVRKPVPKKVEEKGSVKKRPTKAPAKKMVKKPERKKSEEVDSILDDDDLR